MFDTHILSFRPFIAVCWVSVCARLFCRSCRNRDLHLYPGLYVDDDLLDDLGGRVQTGGVILANPLCESLPVCVIIGTHSINRLCILISYVSQVLLPSPHGVLRVVTLSDLVGRRTGPLTRRSLDLALSISSWQTFSKLCTLRLVRVILVILDGIFDRIEAQYY